VPDHSVAGGQEPAAPSISSPRDNCFQETEVPSASRRVAIRGAIVHTARVGFTVARIGMKALYFAKPLEFRLETPAETLTQGESFAGEFVATNRGDAAQSDLDFSVALAYAEFKDVKDRPGSAFEVRDRRAIAEKKSLAPGESLRGNWEFTLPWDCPITSKSGALFLLYGTRLGEPGGFGMLDLRVNLAPVLETFIATVENQFQFEASSRRFTEGFTEVRLKPPESYPTLEKLELLLRYREGEGIDLVYKAKVKGMDRETRAGLKTRNVTVERKLPPDQAFVGGKLPNRSLFRTAFEEALGEIVPMGMKKG
jgi:hypothetical protein